MTKIRQTTKRKKQSSTPATKEPVVTTEQPPTAPSKDTDLNNILQLVSIIAGAAGIVTAIIWMYGRFYYLGFVESMSIDLLQVFILFEDYMAAGVASFLKVALEISLLVGTYFTVTLIIKVLHSLVPNTIKGTPAYFLLGSGIGLFFIIYVGISFISKILPSLTGFSVLNNYSNLLFTAMFAMGIELEREAFDVGLKVIKFSNEYIMKMLNAQIFIFLAPFILFPLLWTLFTYYQNGYKSGCEIVLNKSKSVIVHSNASLIDKDSSSHKRTESYYLLFTDHTYLYLFNSTNPDNLQPESIMIISRNNIGGLEISGNVLDETQQTHNEEICDDKSKTIFEPFIKPE